jgi:hypothetical protein
MVRTLPFQGNNIGSIPIGSTRFYVYKWNWDTGYFFAMYNSYTTEMLFNFYWKMNIGKLYKSLKRQMLLLYMKILSYIAKRMM